MSLFQLDRQEISSLIPGQPPYRGKQIWDGLYTNLILPWEQTNLPKAIRNELEADDRAQLALSESQQFLADENRTIKTLYMLGDQNQVETVLMKYSSRVTLCVSSQAGCAMGCVFCATGQAGFFRNLSRGEILEQVFRGARTARNVFGARLSNLVFMGMGEPLSNFDNVIEAIQRISFDFGISPRHITVSTVGIVPGIKRMAEQKLPVSLAVSLHAANNSKRTELVPINQRYPLEQIVDALRYYREQSNRRISLEWAMMSGINDNESDAVELAAIALELAAHVNLIPLNPTPKFPIPGSSEKVVADFRRTLTSLGVNATIRQNRGNQIAGACGQLSTHAEPGRIRKITTAKTV